MLSAHINPAKLKNCLLDAVEIGKETGSNPVFPSIGLMIEDGDTPGAQAYVRSQHAVGSSFTDRVLTATETNTVLIEWEEAKELGQAVGKTSAARDATVWVVIDNGRLGVAYGNESIADLPGVEPEDGDIEAINEELDILGQAEGSERGFFAMGIETVKRFSKVRGKCPYLDLMFTDIANTTFVKIGEGFIGGIEAIDRPSVQDPQLLTE